MLLNFSVARRYAQALYTMSKKANTGVGIDEQLADLIKVQAILKDHPPLARALESPTVAGPIKHSILKKLLESRIKPVTLHFFYVLVDKNREVYVTPILEAFKHLMREERNEVEIVLQSATALTDATLKQVQATLTANTSKKVTLQTKVVPELIGGMVIQIGDRVIDGSVRHQLNQIQERLSKASAAAVGG